MVCWKVTLQIEFPLHIFVGGLECLEAIGAILPCSTVGPGPMLRKFLRDVDMLRASLEHHMFGQMSHTALTRPFVARADQIGNVAIIVGFEGSSTDVTFVTPLEGDVCPRQTAVKRRVAARE